MSPRLTRPLLTFLSLSLAKRAPLASAAAPVAQLDTEAYQDRWWKRWAK